jgi:hypothetical protein
MTSQTAQDTAGKARPAAQIGRVVFIAFVGLAAIAWLGIAVGANARTPGLVGLATSVFGGFFVALLIVAVGGGIALKLSEHRPRPRPLLPVTGDHTPEMQAIFSDVEAYRQDVIWQSAERTAWRAPACAAVGLCAWTLIAMTGAPVGALDFVAVMIGGGLVGYGWSLHEATRQYNKTWRERVLPRLAASFGEITWRPPVMPDLTRLQNSGLFPAFREAKAENELAGTHRSIAVNIVDLHLAAVSDEKKAPPAFTGLVTDIDLRREEDTAPATAEGLAALAATHPGLQQRIDRLGSLDGFGRPRAVASGSRLTITLPRTARTSAFQTPAFGNAATGPEALKQLRAAIASILDVVETLA